MPKIKASKTVPDKQKKRLASMPGLTPIVVQTSVQLGDLQHNRYPVRSGLKAGDQVVVSNTALLRTGLPVTIAPASQP